MQEEITRRRLVVEGQETVRALNHPLPLHRVTQSGGRLSHIGHTGHDYDGLRFGKNLGYEPTVLWEWLG